MVNYKAFPDEEATFRTAALRSPAPPRHIGVSLVSPKTVTVAAPRRVWTAERQGRWVSTPEKESFGTFSYLATTNDGGLISTRTGIFLASLTGPDKIPI
jgi:hypothetical protein